MFFVQGDQVGVEVFGSGGNDGIGKVYAMTSGIPASVQPASPSDILGHGNGTECVHEIIEPSAFVAVPDAGVELRHRNGGKKGNMTETSNKGVRLGFSSEEIDNNARVKKMWCHPVREKND